MLLGI